MQKENMRTITMSTITFTLSLLFFTSLANAESFSGFGTKGNPNQTTPALKEPSPIMSTEDFKNTVDQLGQSNQRALKEQNSQEMSKLPSPPGAGMMAAAPVEESTNPAPTAPVTRSSTTTSVTTTTPMGGNPPINANPPPPSNETKQANRPPANTSISGGQQGDSAGPYTGFSHQGTKSNNGSTPDQANPNAGGWSIKY